jgi:hypothetical protein
LQIIKPYAPILEKHGIKYLRRKLIVDQGILNGEFLNEEEEEVMEMPKKAIMKDKILKILIHL